MRPQKLVKYRKTCYTIPSFKWKDVRALTHIYLDAMGGDNAPGCTVAGAIEALRANKELKITLAGDESAISPLLKDCDDVRSRLTVEHCSETITNHDAPVMAVRTKKDSAVVKGMLAVRDGRADGFVYCVLDHAQNRDQAEKQRGLLLYVDRAHAVELEEGQYFISDLLECRVRDQKGNALGIIEDVLQPGANDVYQIKCPDGRRMYLPVLPFVIKQVDVKAGDIVVDEERLPEVAVFED